jgi:hypothetical protein
MPNKELSPTRCTSLIHDSSNLPMMDWSESLILSIGWKAACARCVHREIKENLARTNRSKLDFLPAV